MGSTSMRVKKIVLKLLDEDTNDLKWFHLCYVGSSLYNNFLKTFDTDSIGFADYIADWLKKDFNLDISLTTKKDLNILRAVIVDKYKRLFPVIYNNSDIDINGWIRVWIMQKMEEELKWLNTKNRNRKPR